MKAFFILLTLSLSSNLWALGNDHMVRTFLDSDNRPEALPVTASEASVEVSPNGEISFAGALGAIRGRTGFVGFTGIDLSGSLFSPLQSRGEEKSGISFILRELKPTQLVMTVQLVVTKPSEENTYEFDLTIPSGRRVFLPFSDFFQSFRGQNLGVNYDGSGKIERVRIFLKRSLNERNSSVKIPVSFNLSVEDLYCRVLRSDDQD